MFILRRIHPDKIEVNMNLGASYSIVLKNDSKEEFDLMYSDMFADSKRNPLDDVNTYGFIQGEFGSIQLHRENKYYVMTESGKTFARL